LEEGGVGEETKPPPEPEPSGELFSVEPSKPPEPPKPKGPTLATQARIVLHHLNDVAGKHYREVDTHLDMIEQRLKETGVELEGVKTMIDRQTKLWKGSDMERHLTPQTLFAKSNFAKYYDQRNDPIIPNGVNGSGHHPKVTRNIGTYNDGDDTDYDALARVGRI
jgi:uncharacterized phage protein (TIGR02220 family)